jgi:hypothetical protein
MLDNDTNMSRFSRSLSDPEIGLIYVTLVRVFRTHTYLFTTDATCPCFLYYCRSKLGTGTTSRLKG